MNEIVRLLTTTVIGGVLLVSAPPGNGLAQTTSVKAEDLMTLYGTLKQQIVNNGLRIVDVPSGWVDGPRIKGKILPPSGDWMRTLASGVTRLDVRLVVQTDDNQIVYVSYNGIQQCPKENVDKLVNGELLKAEDCYFIVAPTFETSSERYSWLNSVQAVGKMVEVQRGSHIKYDRPMVQSTSPPHHLH
jgi:Protein of unknown function (DUF3237)